MTLLGRAEIKDSDLTGALNLAPELVVADGGADTALTRGLAPSAVIGDLDSLSPAARVAFADVLRPVDEQDSTDFHKALRNIDAPLVVAVGFSGGRLDHELAALNGLVAHAARPCVILGPETLTFLCPPRLTLELPPETLVSLFPLQPVRVASTGLRWPTTGIAFAPGGRIGTSNASLGGCVVLEAEDPGMLVILPRAFLKAVVAALGAPNSAHWP